MIIFRLDRVSHEFSRIMDCFIRAISDSKRSEEGLARSDGNEVAIFAIRNVSHFGFNAFISKQLRIHF